MSRNDERRHDEKARTDRMHSEIHRHASVRLASAAALLRQAGYEADAERYAAIADLRMDESEHCLREALDSEGYAYEARVHAGRGERESAWTRNGV